MKTLEEKAFEYCKKKICPTCSDNKTCIKTNRIGDCIPTYMEYEAFIAGYKAAQEWISVEDELPKKEMWIIAKSEYPETLPFYKSMFYVLENKEQLKINFTHWRPINND